MDKMKDGKEDNFNGRGGLAGYLECKKDTWDCEERGSGRYQKRNFELTEEKLKRKWGGVLV